MKPIASLLHREDYLSRCFDSAFHHKHRHKRVKPVALSLYFGVPGAGKSTFAAYLAQHDMKRGRPVLIIDEYYFVPFGTKYIFAPAVWKLFKTLSRKPLEEKTWETW